MNRRVTITNDTEVLAVRPVWGCPLQKFFKERCYGQGKQRPEARKEETQGVREEEIISGHSNWRSSHRLAPPISFLPPVSSVLFHRTHPTALKTDFTRGPRPPTFTMAAVTSKGPSRASRRCRDRNDKHLKVVLEPLQFLNRPVLKNGHSFPSPGREDQPRRWLRSILPKTNLRPTI
jgi:hypothetical protein